MKTPELTFVGYALLSAGFAAATAILTKVGVEGVPSNVATAVRTVVVMVLASAAAVASGEHRELARITPRSLLFLVLSGVATGLSWLAYFRALKLGPVSRVAPIDKLSLAITAILAFTFLREPFSWRVGAAVVLIVAGTLLTMR